MSNPTPLNPDPDFSGSCSLTDILGIEQAGKRRQAWRDEVDRKATAWMDAYIEANGLDLSRLKHSDWFHLTRMVPCAIRCFRIGEPVDVVPGEACPECGRVRPFPTVWERLEEDNAET